MSLSSLTGGNGLLERCVGNCLFRTCTLIYKKLMDTHNYVFGFDLTRNLIIQFNLLFWRANEYKNINSRSQLAHSWITFAINSWCSKKSHKIIKWSCINNKLEKKQFVQRRKNKRNQFLFIRYQVQAKTMFFTLNVHVTKSFNSVKLVFSRESQKVRLFFIKMSSKSQNFYLGLSIPHFLIIDVIVTSFPLKLSNFKNYSLVLNVR